MRTNAKRKNYQLTLIMVAVECTTINAFAKRYHLHQREAGWLQGKVSCVYAQRKYGGSRITLLILNLGTRYKLMVSFMPRPLYSREKVRITG